MSRSNKDGRLNADDIAVSYAKTGNITGFVAGSGSTAKSDSTYAGASGASAYTVGDIVTALKQIGILAP
jgi:hypothetical protein